jgi:two-component system, response regulator PdtaR
MPDHSMRKIRLAVADDDATARALLVHLLEALGHELVCVAVDGAELVDQCVDRSVDLVLVDLDMPKMDGLAAAEVLSAKGIPVILVSGHPDVEHVVIAHEPVVAYLSKPVSFASLRMAIEQVWGLRRPSPSKMPDREENERAPSEIGPIHDYPRVGD